MEGRDRQEGEHAPGDGERGSAGVRRRRDVPRQAVRLGGRQEASGAIWGDDYRNDEGANECRRWGGREADDRQARDGVEHTADEAEAGGGPCPSRAEGRCGCLGCAAEGNAGFEDRPDGLGRFLSSGWLLRLGVWRERFVTGRRGTAVVVGGGGGEAFGRRGRAAAGCSGCKRRARALYGSRVQGRDERADVGARADAGAPKCA